MRRTITASGLMAVFLGAVGAHAQARSEWPTKPVKMIVGAPPGSTVDFLGRLTASRLSETLGQQVVVENRPGAGGNVAAQMVAKVPHGFEDLAEPFVIADVVTDEIRVTHGWLSEYGTGSHP